MPRPVKTFRLKQFKVCAAIDSSNDDDDDDDGAMGRPPRIAVLTDPHHIRADALLAEMQQTLEEAASWWEKSERLAIERGATATVKGRRTMRAAYGIRATTIAVTGARIILLRLSSSRGEPNVIARVIAFLNTRFHNSDCPWKVISPYKDSDPHHHEMALQGRLRFINAWEALHDLLEYTRVLQRMQKRQQFCSAATTGGGNPYFNPVVCRLLQQELERNQARVACRYVAPLMPPLPPTNGSTAPPSQQEVRPHATSAPIKTRKRSVPPKRRRT